MALDADTRSKAAHGGCSRPPQPHLDADLLMFGFPASRVTIREAKHHGSANSIDAARRVLDTPRATDAALVALFRDEGARYSRLVAGLDIMAKLGFCNLTYPGLTHPRLRCLSKDWAAEFEALPSEVLDRDALSELLPLGSDFGWAGQIQHLWLLREEFEKVRGLLWAAAARLLDLFFSAEVPRLVAFASRCRRFYLTHGAHPPKVQLQRIEELFTGRTFQPLTVRG